MSQSGVPSGKRIRNQGRGIMLDRWGRAALTHCGAEKCGRMVPLTSEHGIGDTWRLALRGLLRLLLTPRCGCNRVIRRTIGDALERVCDAGQLERNLVGSAGPLQHDDSFSAEVQRSPE